MENLSCSAETGQIRTLVYQRGADDEVPTLLRQRVLGAPGSQAGDFELLRTLARVLCAAQSGPSPSWLRRRVAPLQATLCLLELPTTALLQQYRIQPTGPTRAAPLVALALRLDDREAAEILAETQPAELAEGEQLAVDGLPALEAYRKLEPLV